MIIGSHVSFGSNQLLGSAKEAASYGASTFMFYTGAPQNTIRKEIDENLTNEALKYMQASGINIENVVCHAPYIINLANRENEAAWNFSCSFLKQEISRISKMHVNYIVVHPGNSLKMDRNVALDNIASAINLIIDEDTKPMILLETMAGKGTEIGRSFEEIKTIIDKVSLKEKLGICLDTCHINDAGYDVSDIDKVLNEFDKIIGLEYLKAIHLNDSMNELGSHKDRHQKIGEGTIGITNFEKIINHPVLRDLPFYLETPNDLTGYAKEISLLRNLYKS